MRFNISNSFPKLWAKDLSLYFDDAIAPVFTGLDLSVDAGQILAIHGANSSGKSSLINCLCGIIPKSIRGNVNGEVLVGKQALTEIPLCEISRLMSVAVADAQSMLLMPTVELEIAFALENKGLEPQIIRERIAQAASRFGLMNMLPLAPQKLSGGEQRLLLFAMCDALQNPILLLDEPETGLSANALELLVAWLKTLRNEGKAIVLSSHNPQLISLADNQIKLDKVYV
ncbi:MAG: ABC transporter ATP-binding protein [Candidatus Cloacimonetes bacterium]|nr:ABC transporter ATP-binding protein [Candidatus Cloacimonadota bacterium]